MLLRGPFRRGIPPLRRQLGYVIQRNNSVNTLSIRIRLAILLSAMWVLAFLGNDTEHSLLFIFGIMPIVIVWGLHWIKSQWFRFGIIISFIWIVIAHETYIEGNAFVIVMLLPALFWGIALSRNRWWKQ